MRTHFSYNILVPLAPPPSFHFPTPTVVPGWREHVVGKCPTYSPKARGATPCLSAWLLYQAGNPTQVRRQLACRWAWTLPKITPLPAQRVELHLQPPIESRIQGALQGEPVNPRLTHETCASIEGMNFQTVGIRRPHRVNVAV